MKKTMLKTLTAFAVLASATSAFATGGREGTVYTQAQVDAVTAAEVAQWMNSGAHFQPGVYVGGGAVYAGVYIAGDSVYAGNSAGNQSSLVVTEEQITRVSIAAITDIVSARLDNRTGRNGGSQASANTAFDTSVTGANGGSSEAAFGLWSRLDWTSMNSTDSAAKWNAKLWTLALGGDYKINERVLAGVALTYGYVTGKTNFNHGKIKGDHAFGVNPYLNVIATNWLNFDAIAGYARVNKKRDRNPVGGTKVTAKTHSNRYFFSAISNAHKAFGKVNVLGKLGYTYGKDAQKKYTESNGDVYGSQDTKISRLFVILETAFAATEAMSPFVKLTYDHDFSITKHGLADGINNDVTGYQKPKQNTSNWYGAGAGLRFNASRNWTGEAGYHFKTTKKIRMHNVNVRLRYQF